ncbi:MAG: hypothetical protein ABIS84_12865 [Arachnia sp.]
MASLLAACVYLVWWLANGSQTNSLTIMLAAVLGSLVVVSVLHMATSGAAVRLLAVGLWIFLALSVGGLAAAATATRTDILVVNMITIRMVLSAAAVSSYAVAILGVRYAWILRPMAQVTAGSTVFPDAPSDEYPPVSPLSDGYFLHERQVAQSKWISSIQALSGSPDKARHEWMLVEAYDAVATEAGRAISAEVLGNEIAGNKTAGTTETDPALIRQHALLVAIHQSDVAAGRSIFLMKVQNQLCIFALILLSVVGVFSALGWAVPMLLAAAASILFRMRDLAPVGKTTSYDGGARWMALFLTPLTGAVSAVLGLTVISALADVHILSAEVSKYLENIPELRLDARSYTFGPLVLALAVAFGWSARLLDDLLKSLTAAVDKQAGDGGVTSPTIPPVSSPTTAAGGQQHGPVPVLQDPAGDPPLQPAEELPVEPVGDPPIGPAGDPGPPPPA